MILVYREKTNFEHTEHILHGSTSNKEKSSNSSGKIHNKLSQSGSKDGKAPQTSNSS